ncbi:mechanosensitive ion channel family protein [Ancylobacter lacus]|uniref:mechanosensitive ion channel family protein n=1 Tax=Ancylobacter lacus TaxID=2579970 RepID=UPI001BCCBF8F|nr:mechanosensitive ion channel domain-containing protein [Ancylobacter lacus]MBS7540260.1 mechanosensitive ion channel [Ancylobacter lacus]
MDLERLGNLLILYGLNVLYAIGLMVAGWWIARLVERLVQRALAATRRVDPTIVGFLSSLARYAVLVFVGIAVLQRFGIQTTSIIAVLGATSLAIGLALQGTLSNLAAGVMLLLFRPFRVGDAVELAGRAGTVKGLTLFNTELAAGDNVQVLIPNGQVWGAAIVNQSAYGERRLDLAVELKPDIDSAAVMADGLAFLRADARALATPAPGAGFGKILIDRVEVVFSAWARSGDVGALKADLASHLRERMAAAPKPG